MGSSHSQQSQDDESVAMDATQKETLMAQYNRTETTKFGSRSEKTNSPYQPFSSCFIDIRLTFCILCSFLVTPTQVKEVDEKFKALSRKGGISRNKFVMAFTGAGVGAEFAGILFDSFDVDGNKYVLGGVTIGSALKMGMRSVSLLIFAWWLLTITLTDFKKNDRKRMVCTHGCETWRIQRRSPEGIFHTFR